MSVQNGRAFNEWLRTQLKAKKMSQRQLAQQSGVDHSTISRLVRGDRMPSLGTATKLARGLRELGENDEGPQYLGLMGGGVQNPTARPSASEGRAGRAGGHRRPHPPTNDERRRPERRRSSAPGPGAWRPPPGQLMDAVSSDPWTGSVGVEA